MYMCVGVCVHVRVCKLEALINRCVERVGYIATKDL